MTILRVVATNIEMFSGDTRVLRVTIKDQDEVVLDITGASAQCTLAKRHGMPPIFTKTVGVGITITDPVNGILEVTWLPADTEPLAGAYAYEVELTDAAGRKSTVLYGTVQIRRNTG